MTDRSLIETALNRAMIHWALSRPVLVEQSPSGSVYRVEQADGRFAALKLLQPGASDERRGAALLGWYGGEGAAGVIDAEAGAILLEWLDGETLAAMVADGNDTGAIAVICGVISQLHLPRAGRPPDLLPLRQHFAALIESRLDAWPVTSRDLYGRAKGIALSLFDRPAAVLPLHGDIHHGNILHGSRGWLSIDPKGLLGDPAYEVANSFLNPWSMRDLVIDQNRIHRLADQFSSRFGFDRKRVIGFAAAQAALSACWDLGAGRPINHQLAALPNLLAVWEQA